MRHVVWDWNGTLLDDLPLVVESVNAVLAEASVPPIGIEDYTANYTRPVRRFYELLYGRAITDDEWHRLDRVFHDHYDRAVLDHSGLAPGAREAIGSLGAAGRTQSLLSMYPHEQLVPLVDHHALSDVFVHVQGLTGVGGGVKLPHLERHLASVSHLAGDDPSHVTLIGDALDDASAAASVGARCILLASGSHPREELEQARVPVVDDLAAAVELLL